ncbi:hypothetical protein P170DRAFT_265659 [Aspergillus steynii IBT 23096]|uniref:protein-histidine N-methyltransferase n=1 Tax=Aspergillus steynii IBT 23096 TaxID=1392250 RepID=A0A2I2FVR0_9EURO|nr:uncharacterized protein P170DRAFT_265659 [Aspergillus steynii IBT 23096]PLB44729.1 hypothetical protein P170DRAFT_265659 [Aspergillus steynii IBT 23096]
MASAFSFGFSGDDIDIDDSELNGIEDGNVSLPQDNKNELPSLVEARKHDMKEWVSTLPSQISYNRLELNGLPNRAQGKPLSLARREVFDIRTQLMAEDTADHENEQLIAGLEKGDIKPQFYEGGFKTWECALDLAKLVVSEDHLSGSAGESLEGRHIIELGAGTAVPSLALFAQLFSESTPSGSQRKSHFTFADYNSAVLRLVTLPNLLLTWNHIVTAQNSPLAEATSPEGQTEEEEELDITPELIESFEKDLASRGITIEFVSGAWSPTFVDLVLSSPEKAKSRTLILASETIYSPASLGAFSETLLALLRATEANTQSRALIAAKRVYFGVGGGVDEFLEVFKGVGGGELEVTEQLNIKSEGVGRVVLEIATRSPQ